MGLVEMGNTFAEAMMAIKKKEIEYRKTEQPVLRLRLKNDLNEKETDENNENK
jgi:hypothetical protein